jgi:hypothetical protein
MLVCDQGGSGGAEYAYAVDFGWLLRVGGTRDHEDAEGEGEDEPDDAEPHGGVLHNTRTLTGGEHLCSPRR